MCPSNMRGLNPRSSAWQADALPAKLMLHIGAGGGIRTHKSLAQGILSPSCMPFHHTRIYKTSVFELVAFANSAIPLYLAGEPRFELGSQLRPRGLISITKNYFAVKVFIYFLYILYHIFYKKSNKIFWLPLWDSNPDNLLQRDITVLETGVLPLDEGAIWKVKDFLYL